MGIWQTCYPIDIEEGQYHACTKIEQLPDYLNAVLTDSSIVPEWELITCRVLFFIIFFVEAITIYWPFYGYTTRSYGFMMSAVGHIITGLIAITAVVIWESGHRKTFNNIISIPSHIDMGLKFDILAMPAVTITAVIILFFSSIIAFLFTCQPNFSHEHDAGNKFFQRITRMSMYNKKDATKSKKTETKKETPKLRIKPVPHRRLSQVSASSELEIHNARTKTGLDRGIGPGGVWVGSKLSSSNTTINSGEFIVSTKKTDIKEYAPAVTVPLYTVPYEPRGRSTTLDEPVISTQPKPDTFPLNIDDIVSKVDPDTIRGLIIDMEMNANPKTVEPDYV